MCNHIIGLWYEYEDTDNITFDDLQDKIKSQNRLYKTHPYLFNDTGIVLSLSGYLDKRGSTNLLRYNFCPKCGYRINWEELKKIVKEEEEN